MYAQEWDCWVIWQFYFQISKHLHTGRVQETQVQSLGQEDALEKGMATHSAGVQPQQDPKGTLGMNGISEREREREDT